MYGNVDKTSSIVFYNITYVARRDIEPAIRPLKTTRPLSTIRQSFPIKTIVRMCRTVYTDRGKTKTVWTCIIIAWRKLSNRPNVFYCSNVVIPWTKPVFILFFVIERDRDYNARKISTLFSGGTFEPNPRRDCRDIVGITERSIIRENTPRNWLLVRIRSFVAYDAVGVVEVGWGW